MKKAVVIIVSILMCLAIFVGCNPTNSGEYDEDKYTSDGKLIISFFGVDIDSLQSPTDDTRMVVDYIENKFNVKFDFISGSADGWKTVLNQNIGGGEVPDIWFHEVDQPQYSKWLKDEILTDFEPYLKDYPNMKKAFERYDVDQMRAYLGGGLYGFPLVLDDSVEDDLTNVHAMYYRRDWYDNVVAKGYVAQSGKTIKDPEDPTFDHNDFYDLMEAYTKGDPDNDGKNNTYGLVLTKDGGIYWWYPILSMFGCANMQWFYNESTGRLEPNVINEQTKQALDFMAKMYDNGLIYQSYATTGTTARIKNEFLNGSAGCMVFNAQFEHAVGILQYMEPFTKDSSGQTVKSMSDVVRGMPVVTNVNGEKKIWGHTNKYGYRSINRYCSENKKRKIFDIMEWMLSDEGMRMLNNGIEGTHYHIENGQIVSDLPKGPDGRQYAFFNSNIARGVYFLKGLVSWSTPIAKTEKFYDEALQVSTAWKHENLEGSITSYCAVNSAFAITAKELEDITTIAFQKIVGKTSTNDRQSIWNEFVANYKSKGNSYINAINRSAEELGILAQFGK